MEEQKPPKTKPFFQRRRPDITSNPYHPRHYRKAYNITPRQFKKLAKRVRRELKATEEG